jgi:uncharacterized protein (TIGR00369 family)
VAAVTVQLPPYAELIGASVDHWSDGYPVIAVDYSDRVRGNPGTFHGGVLGGLADLAVTATLQAMKLEGADGRPFEVLNTTIEYLRGGLEKRTFARAAIIRAGKRLACIKAEIWQDDPVSPCAIAIVNCSPA